MTNIAADFEKVDKVILPSFTFAFSQIRRRAFNFSIHICAFNLNCKIFDSKFKTMQKKRHTRWQLNLISAIL